MIRFCPRIALVVALFVPLSCGKPKLEAGADAASATPSAAAAPSLVDFSEPPAPASAAASAAPAPSSSAATPERPHSVQRRGAVGQFLTRARALELTEEQKTKLDALDEKLWSTPPEDEAVKTAYAGFYAALIEGVKVGHVADAKLQPHYAVLDARARVRHESEAQALGELHDLLEPEQRKQLVEALRKKYPSPAEQAAKPKKPPPTEKDKAKREAREKRRLARVTALLGLDEKQQLRVTPILARFASEPLNRARRAQMEKRMRALIAAFERDELDATKLEVGKGPKARMADRVAFIATLLTILKADQRGKLARTIERPGSRRWGAAVVGDVAPAEEE